MFGTMSETEIAQLRGTLARARLSHRMIKAAFDSMTAALSDDLKVYVEVQRHSLCHLRVSALEVSVKGKPGGDRSLKGEATLSLLGRPMVVEDLEGTPARVLQAHGGSELEVARAIAALIRDHSAAMHDGRRLLG
jgi:hypothetical protein